MLLVVLGSRTVEMLVTQSLTIHGRRASRLANVSCDETETELMACVAFDAMVWVRLFHFVSCAVW